MAEEGNGWRPRPLRAALIVSAAPLAVAGIATGVLALPAAAAACLAGALILPRSRRSSAAAADSGSGEPESAETFDELDVSLAAQSLLDAISGRVAPEVYDQVSRICQLVLVGLRSRGGGLEAAESGANPEPDPAAAADPDTYRLRQTVLSYLPGALDAYLAVPGIYATRGVRGRKSPRRTLDEQLQLIEDACRRLTEGMVAADADRLEAHGRFLRATLGRSNMDIEEAGASPAEAGASAQAPAPAPAPATAKRERVR